jgi:hypothetical protein
MLLLHAGVDERIVAADWEHSIRRLTRYYAQKSAGEIKNDYLSDPNPELLNELRGQVTDFLAMQRTEGYFDAAVRARLL